MLDTADYARFDFNPHSPCGERPCRIPSRLSMVVFQSTLPLRGATWTCRKATRRVTYFNPHSPCGERPGRPCFIPPSRPISIHTPLAGSDSTPRDNLAAVHKFQSTLPLRGATKTPPYGNDQWTDFNPHSPCGERHGGKHNARWNTEFQSTLPLRGATTAIVLADYSALISIHTPLAGSDSKRARSRLPQPYFNPHSPCGERRSDAKFLPRMFHFNPHSPCGERPSSMLHPVR